MIKSKEKRNPRRPWLFYQEATDNTVDRLRILYPDGRSQYAWGEHYFMKPCWSRKHEPNGEEVFGISTNRGIAFRAMRRYDKTLGFKPAEFLGNL